MFLRRSTDGFSSCPGWSPSLLTGASPLRDAHAQAKKLKIGVVFDYTGPLAGGGSDLHALGAKIMIDYFAKKGGVEGYQIEAIYADAQSKPEIAINEAVRLIEQEKVDMLLGFYSSAQCVPAAARVEQLHKFMWITTCISSAVLENRNLKYVFRVAAERPPVRPHVHGLPGPERARPSSGKDPKDLRVAIIHEDGAYGVDVSKGNEEGAKKAGFNVVLKEGYSATAPDLAPLVTKLKRARPDVIFHTGYNPDISLFLRQSRELGLRFSALIGHGAGYGVYDKLKESLGKDVNYFFNVDPISIWLANEKALKPELLPLIKMVGDEYEKARPGTAVRSAHVGMAASNTYVFMTEVLPRAIKKYGGDRRRRAPQGRARGRSCRRAAPCWASGSSSRARARRWPGRTSAPSRSSCSTWTTSRTWCGRRACSSASRCCSCRPPRPTRRSDAGPRQRVTVTC